MGDTFTHWYRGMAICPLFHKAQCWSDLNSCLKLYIQVIRLTRQDKTRQDQQHSAILCARNRQVDEINNAMQSIISKCQETPILTLYSKDTKYEALDTETESHFSHKFLGTINDPGVPPHTLKLQEGDICFLARNIGFRDGNTNNTKVQITSINNRARVITIRNLRTGHLHPISRISFILCVKSRKRKAINYPTQAPQVPLSSVQS